jgi:hypothetical protein
MLQQQVTQKEDALAALAQQTQDARQLLASAAAAFVAVGSDAAESSMQRQNPSQQLQLLGEECEPMDMH